MSSPNAALDVSVQITTPENIRFEYRLAGPFRRMPALFLDFVFRAVVLTAVFIVGACSGAAVFFPGGGVLLFVALSIGYFLFTWFYGLFFEAMWNGQTPGKRLLGLRVISVDGRPINAVQATIRNFLRVADTAPILSLEYLHRDFPPMYAIPTFLVAMVCMILTRRVQRIGDLAAGTMVVVDERAWLSKGAKFSDPRIQALAEFIPAGFRMTRTLAQTVALFVDRRDRLSIGHRNEVAALIAQPLLQRFGFQSNTSPDLLLCALYYREFIAKSAEAWTLDASETIPHSPYGSPFAEQPAGVARAQEAEHAAVDLSAPLQFLEPLPEHTREAKP
jgi:uncharacterized RDD family membrane protein YckC